MQNIQATKIPFSKKISALNGVELHDRFIDLEAVNGTEIDTREVYKNDLFNDFYQEKVLVTETHVIVGALVHDDDASYCNPMDNDCANGSILHRNDRSRRETVSFDEAIGYNRDGDKDFDHDGVLMNLGDLLFKKVADTKGLAQSLGWVLRKNTDKNGSHESIRACLKDACERGGTYEDFAHSFCGKNGYRVDELTEKLLDKVQGMIDELLEPAWKKAVQEGQVGNPLAVMLDIYDHSGRSYSLHNEGMQCRWDTSSCAAVWVPNDLAEENIRTTALAELNVGQVKWMGSLGDAEPLHAAFSIDGGVTWVSGFKTWSQAIHAMLEASPKKVTASDVLAMMRKHAREYARGVVEEYSKWCNGEVYGIASLVINRANGDVLADQIDSCWGFIGGDYAEEELESQLFYLAEKFSTVTN